MKIFILIIVMLTSLQSKRLSTAQKKLEKQYKKQFTKFLDEFQKQNNRKQKFKPRILEEDNLRDGLNIGENNYMNDVGYAAGGFALLLSEIMAYHQRNSGLFGLRQELHGERMAFETLYESELNKMEDILNESSYKLDDLDKELDRKGNYIFKMIQQEADKRQFGIN